MGGNKGFVIVPKYVLGGGNTRAIGEDGVEICYATRHAERIVAALEKRKRLTGTQQLQAKMPSLTRVLLDLGDIPPNGTKAKWVGLAYDVIARHIGRA